MEEGRRGKLCYGEGGVVNGDEVRKLVLKGEKSSLGLSCLDWEQRYRLKDNDIYERNRSFYVGQHLKC